MQNSLVKGAAVNKISKVLVVGSLLLSGGAFADSADTEIPVIQTLPPFATDEAEPQQVEDEADKAADYAQSAIEVAGEYGPTQASVTLWAIAKLLADEQGVSAWKMQNALYKTNRQAFNNNDINSLMVGVMLKVPDLSRASASAGRLQPVINKLDNSGNSQPVSQPVPAPADNGQPKVEKLEQQLDSMQKLLISREQQLVTLQQVTVPKAAPVQEDPSANIFLLLIGGFVAGVLAMFGWIYWRNRQFSGADEKKSQVVAHHTADKFVEADSRIDEAGWSNDEFGYSFDFAPPIPIMEDDTYDADLDDSEDEATIESGIDLAKAYMDMGDAEAARSALANVLKKGTQQQRETAEALLGELKP
jgi:FimV-like protein